LVTLDDPGVEIAADGAILARSFALTPAEARLAVLIGSGIAPVEAAKRERVTIETIRKRLKVLFAKTGTHRQSELAVVVSQLTRPWGAGRLLADGR
jgi:DNA-binding CsgD family transcriptional regulator